MKQVYVSRFRRIGTGDFVYVAHPQANLFLPRDLKAPEVGYDPGIHNYPEILAVIPAMCDGNEPIEALQDNFKEELQKAARKKEDKRPLRVIWKEGKPIFAPLPL